MQLLIILALLLYGGKTNAANILSEVKPVLESIGGEGMKEALKNAEEISTVLSAVQGMGGFSGGFTAANPPADQPFGAVQTEGFPLAPVSAIADKDITYSLSQYISQT